LVKTSVFRSPVRRARRALVHAHRRFREARGGVVAAALALNLFIGLFPALVVVSAVVGFTARTEGDVDRRIVEWLGLHGPAARLVSDAVTAAARSAPAASVVGLLGLAWSGLGVFRALDDAFGAVGGTRGRGTVARLVGLVWLAGAAVLLVVSTLLIRLASLVPALAVPLVVVASAASDAALFTWSSRLFVPGPVPLRARLPGAAVFAVGMAALKPVATIVVPRIIASSSALYGSIGAIFGVLLWIRLVALLTVFAATVNASLPRDGGS
jgi:membrane protein